MSANKAKSRVFITPVIVLVLVVAALGLIAWQYFRHQEMIQATAQEESIMLTAQMQQYQTQTVGLTEFAATATAQAVVNMSSTEIFTEAQLMDCHGTYDWQFKMRNGLPLTLKGDNPLSFFSDASGQIILQNFPNGIWSIPLDRNYYQVSKFTGMCFAWQSPSLIYVIGDSSKVQMPDLATSFVTVLP